MSEKAKTLGEAELQVAVATIQNFGTKMTLPEGMTLDQGIDLLQRRKKYDTEKTVVRRIFPVFPLDGAVSLDNVLRRKYGWAQAIATPGFFGPNPPEMRTIKVGPNKTRAVTWGRFTLPGVNGFLQTNAQQVGGSMWFFELVSEVRRADEPKVKELMDDVAYECTQSSIYRGQAIKISFRNEDGDREMPDPEFMDTESIDENMVVFSEVTQHSIRTNLFTPITRVPDLIRNGIPIKRGVLLGGTYGTGKTLAASVASKLAVQHGITYLYVPRADQLKDAIEFAKLYQNPASVVFCEDIDRVTSGERGVAMDDILNIIDGIDTKTANIIVVLTTNHLDTINPAMLRPGRLDAVIPVTAPDAKAVEKLIRVYAKGAVNPETDLTSVGVTLEGHIPAIIAEVVKRAKLSELSLLAEGERVKNLSAEALLEAAQTMNAQIQLLESAINQDAPPDFLKEGLVDTIREAMELAPRSKQDRKNDRVIKKLNAALG